MSDDLSVQRIRQDTESWVRNFVIAHNLCPFAKREVTAQRVHFTVTLAASEQALLLALDAELTRLLDDPSIETTLLIHPAVLNDFQDYNQFLDTADRALELRDLVGEVQIASFHPQYQFAGTLPDDVTSLSNRSPYPMLHLLREASVARAIQAYPDVEQIPSNNLKVLRELFG